METIQQKEAGIINRIRNGDESLISLIYKDNRKLVTIFLKKRKHSQQCCEDIYQDCFITFIKKIKEENFVLSSKISTFICGIALNLSLKEYERNRRLSFEEKEVGYTQSTSFDNDNEVVTYGLSKIPKEELEVLKLYYYDGLNMSEVAKKMNYLNADVAKSKKYKAKLNFQKIIRKRYTKEDIY